MRPEDTVRQHGGCRAGLPGRTFPPGDWSRPAEHLEELYVWVEQRALLVGDRYLSDRVAKRRGARVLRTGAAAGVAAGAAAPLLALTGALPERFAAWGFLALLCAALCVGGDRCFGLTTGWIRDVATAQAVQRRLESLQYDWASQAVREVLGPTEGSAGEAADRGLALLRRFTEDVSEIVRAETADWMVEFGSARSLMRLQSAAPHPVRPPEGQETHARRPHAPPGFRAAMPRQRPPEDPR